MNIKKNNDFIYKVADLLRGTYWATNYKEVIILFFVMKWLEEKLKDKKEKLCFYNNSEQTLKKIAKNPKAEILIEHLNQYSENVLEIFNLLEYQTVINRLEKNHCLSKIINLFAEHQIVDSTQLGHHMGYVFEEIIRKFSKTPEAGDHYTPCEVVKLLTKVLTAKSLEVEKKVINVLDMACGSGGMLVTSLKELSKNKKIGEINIYGQEINNESCGICKSNVLIHGKEPEKIRLSNTMKEDCFKGILMDYVICNPPFGQPWGGKGSFHDVEEYVVAEHRLGHKGRFGPGLPATTDMQLLFFLHAVKKLDVKGKAALICNNSILHAGSATSGDSKIRQYLLKEDLIECIIALPSDLFYNTSIQIFAVIINKCKEEHKKGKIALINAEEYCYKIDKSFGYKKKEIKEEHIDQIVEMCVNWDRGKYEGHSDIKVFNHWEFLYWEYTYSFERERLVTNKEVRGKTRTSVERVRDAEQIPYVLGGDYFESVNAHFNEHIKSFYPDAKLVESSVPIVGCKILFPKYFYELKGIKDVKNIREELIELNKESAELLDRIFKDEEKGYFDED